MGKLLGLQHRLNFAVALFFAVSHLMFSVSAHGADSAKFCESTDGLNEIKANLACSVGGARFTACRWLTAMNVGMQFGMVEAGAYHVWAANRFREMLKTKGPEITRELARNLHELGTPHLLPSTETYLEALDKQAASLGKAPTLVENARRLKIIEAEKAGIKRAVAADSLVRQPIVRQIGDTFVDIANIKFRDLPEIVKVERVRDAEALLKQIRFNVDHNPIKLATQMIDDAAESIKKSGYPSAQSASRVTIETFTREELSNGIGRVINNAKVRMIGSVLKGGVIGLLTGIVDSTNNDRLFCDMGPHNNAHMNLDKNCKPVYKVNRGVAEFLGMPGAKQLALLKDPVTCDYYKKLHAAVFDSPKVTEIRCGTDSHTFQLTEKSGKKLASRIMIAPNSAISNLGFSDGDMTVSVGVTNDQMMKSASVEDKYSRAKFEFDPFEDLKKQKFATTRARMLAEETSKRLRFLNLLVSDVQYCCSLPGNSCQILNSNPRIEGKNQEAK